MIPWNAEAQVKLNGSEAVEPHWSIWVDALDLDGAPAPIGIWDDPEARELRIGDEHRLHHGSTGRFEVPEITWQAGIRPTRHTIGLPAGEAAAETLFRGRRTEMREVWLHLGLYDPADGRLIDRQTLLRGYVDALEEATGGGEAGEIALDLTIISRSVKLTKTHDRRQNDEGFKVRRLPDGRRDRIGRYADVSGARVP